MMLVVLAVTIATVYLAEKNRRANQQQLLDAQFQNRVQSFLKIQEAQSEVITKKCLALSRSVRLRAALEERDVDDLHQNALTELEGILEHSPNSSESGSEVTRASFFRFFDADGSGSLCLALDLPSVCSWPRAFPNRSKKLWRARPRT
jgi:hypothetical protein